MKNTDNYEYSDPEFSWEKVIAPTALDFAPSSFVKYENWLFVGDCNFGNIYKFKLNSDRNGFVFEDFHLNDLVLHEEDNIEEILFGEGFGCITDIEIRGDDMYVVSIFDGTIYRIFLKDLSAPGLKTILAAFKKVVPGKKGIGLSNKPFAFVFIAEPKSLIVCLNFDG